MGTAEEGIGPASVAHDGTGVRIAVRVKPRARRAAVEGIVADADGRRRLAVVLTEAPEGGRANAALIALLARRWRLPKSAFAVAAGARARRKTVMVAGDPATILARIAAEGDTG